MSIHQSFMQELTYFIGSVEERTQEERERNKRYMTCNQLLLTIERKLFNTELNFVSDLSRQNEIAKKNLEKIQAQLKSTDSELAALKKVAMSSHSIASVVHFTAKFCSL